MSGTVDVKFLLLSDRPEEIDTIAAWYYERWAKKDGSSLEKVKTKLIKFLKPAGLLLIVLAYDNAQLVGAAQLKYREMSIYPDYEHWLGGLYVTESARGRGIGGRLVERIKLKAKDAGAKTLYLQTEYLDGGLYNRYNFIKLNEVHYRGYYVTVMKCEIDV